MASAREPVAIVGIGCRLPGGIVDASSAWQAWVGRVDGIVDIPPTRWDAGRFYDPTGRAPHRAYVHRAGLLHEDHALFDAGFFGFSGREAQTLDPQQRLLAVASWEAMEDAGIAPTSLAGTETGVFVGAFTSDALLLWCSPLNQRLFDTGSAMGATHTMLSNRLSYLYDFRGPSMTVDTACSSAMVALHLACRSLWQGDCTDALVGGVNALLVPETHVVTARGQFLSRRGRCAAFSAEADGYVRSEGVVVLALRPLSVAQANGNPVYAVIRATATNQDGRTNGIAMPSEDAQVALMRRAYRDAGVDPRDVSYVEAHGTGTAAGDPIEANAIARVVGVGSTREAACLVGSVKTNIGHLEAGAGVAGVMKAALCLTHGAVPPHLHFDAPNPAIDFDALKLKVPTALTPLPDGPVRFVGVNSFGYGGSNGHAVLQQAPAAQAQASAPLQPGVVRTVFLSAKAGEAVGLQAERWAQALEQHPAHEADLLFTAAAGRTHHRHRLAVWGSSREELISTLRASARSLSEGPQALFGAAESSDMAQPTFVFAGMGPQWPRMGADLLEHEPTFRKTLARADAFFRQLAGWSLVEALSAPADQSRILRTEVTQPATVAVQMGLVEVLKTWGVMPGRVIGHSVGEIAAAWAAGALGFEDALTLAFHRGRLLQRFAGRGGMLAVGLGTNAVYPRLAAFDGRVGIAADNAPDTVTLSGEDDALTELHHTLTGEGVFSRRLSVEIPYHGPVMAELRDELLAALSGLEPKRPTTPFISTVTGGDVHDLPLDGQYWYLNVRNPVRFREGLTGVLAQGVESFVEISPHPVLGHAVAQNAAAAKRTARVVGTLRRDVPGASALAETAARLYVAGLLPKPEAVVAKARLTRLAPKYAFLKTRCWAETKASEQRRVALAKHPLVSEERLGPWPQCVAEASSASHPFLADHLVGGRPVFPAAGSLELLFATLGPGTLHDVVFSALCVLEPTAIQRLVATARASETQPGTIHLMRDEEAPLLLATAARHSPQLEAAPDTRRPPVDAFESIATDDLYGALGAMGLKYGPAFRTVRWLGRDGHRVLARLELADGCGAEGWHLHPTLLDGAIHALIGVATFGADGPVVPARVERVSLYSAAPPSRVVWASGHFERTASVPGSNVVASFTLFAEEGGPLAHVERLHCQALPRERHAPASWFTERAFISYEPPTPSDDDGPPVQLLETTRALEATTFKPGAIVCDARWFRMSDEYDRSWAEADSLAQTLRVLVAKGVSRYVFVTRHASAVLPGEPEHLRLAPLLGLLRTAMAEWPALRITLLDVDWPALEYPRLQHTVRRLGSEQELAIRHGAWFCSRLARVSLPAHQPELTLRPNATYVVTGASSGLGVEVARWLVARGAKHLALLSRRGAKTPEAANLIRRLGQAGVAARAFSTDVGQRDALEATLKSVTADMPPVRGLVHAAGILDDRPLAELTLESLRAVAAPKADAALTLHHFFLKHGVSLDFAVWCSSVSALIGNVGQGNYVAANAVLDALTSHRRALGLASTTVQWGVLGEVGMVARDAQVGKQLAWLGFRAMPVTQTLNALETAVACQLGTVGVVDVDWSQMARSLDPWAGRARLSGLIDRDDGGSGLWAMATGQRSQVIESVLRASVTRVLRLDHVDPAQPLTEIGLDSLMAMEIAASVRQALPVEVSSMDLASGASIRRLATHLAEKKVS